MSKSATGPSFSSVVKMTPSVCGGSVATGFQLIIAVTIIIEIEAIKSNGRPEQISHKINCFAFTATISFTLHFSVDR